MPTAFEGFYITLKKQNLFVFDVNPFDTDAVNFFQFASRLLFLQFVGQEFKVLLFLRADRALSLSSKFFLEAPLNLVWCANRIT